MSAVDQPRVRRRRVPRLAVGLAAIAAALGVSACGSSDDGGGGASAGSRPHVGKQVAIVEALSGDAGYMKASCGAIEEGRRLGFKMDAAQGPKEWDAVKFAGVTSAVLARQPDGLVYMPEDPKTSLPPVKPAVAQGLKLVTIDATLADPSLVTSFIASDHYAGGQLAAREVLRLIGGRGKVLTEAVAPGHPIQIARVQGFESVIKDAPGVEYLGAHYPRGDADVTTIASDAAAVLRKHPDIAAIYTTVQPSAEGSITALREAGLLGKVKIVEWDANEYGLKELRAGAIDTLVAQHPEEAGSLAVQQLAKAFDGERAEPEVHSGLTLITKDNLDDPEVQELIAPGHVCS
jgi:ribose transport system substrate-binding protein